MKSFEAKIYVGFKEFTNNERTTFIEHTLEECESLCQKYCTNIGLCVTVTPTKYIYTQGNEYGAIIGFIQYPRFPLEEEGIKKRALELGEILMMHLGQLRVTINFPDSVEMLTNHDLLNKFFTF